MHAFFRPFGIYPNNAIVGASAPIATGAALYKRVQAEPGIVVANIGDASAGCGPVWEALNFAAMGQIRSLWPEARGGGLPMVFFFMNNFYGMGGQTIGETMAFDLLAGSAPASTRTTCTPRPWTATTRCRSMPQCGRAVEPSNSEPGRCSSTPGLSPVGALPDRCLLLPHPEEIELWKAVDPIVEYRERIEAEGLIDAAGCDEMSTWARPG